MKKIIIILGFLIILVIIGYSIKKETVSCEDFPDNEDCVCSEGLVKKARTYFYNVNRSKEEMYHCVNIECNNSEIKSKSLGNTCVESCPDGYIDMEIHKEFESRVYNICFFIKNKSEMMCDKFPGWHDDCICPEGQKKIATSGGFSCFDESFCEDYTLSDDESVCVEECPVGYLSDLCTGCISHTCINVKEIDEGNFWRYGVHLLRTSNFTFTNSGVCRITDEFVLEDKFEVIIRCFNLEGNCSLYIYENTTYEFGDCPYIKY